ncbi:MAG: RluA family pseudouridine synthase [Clostridia bacterium]|nr:RluA family pseudouridine synthase [Clostridia bacterium]
MIEFTHGSSEVRLSKAIVAKYPTVTYSTVLKALRNKDVIVNGSRVKEDIKLHNGDVVKAYIQPHSVEYELLYQDDNLAVVYKPKGIAVTGDNSLTSILSSEHNLIPCHRLDTNTDGLILYAKSDEYFHHIKDAMHYNQINKYYLARVWGIPANTCQVLKAYLTKNSNTSSVRISDVSTRGSVPITTTYDTVEVLDDGTSILEVSLIAGKTHQIRAHLAHIGHPIIGDSKYCPREIRQKFRYNRQLLTAYKLVFDTSGALEYMKGKVISISPNLYK